MNIKLTIKNRLIFTFLFSAMVISTSHVSKVYSSETSNPLSGLQTQGIQAMMGSMQEIQTCMSGIDQNALMSLGEQAKKVQSTIKKHCESGNAKKAEQEALSFANTLQNSKVANQAQGCLKDIPDMMKGHLPGTNITDLKNQLVKKDICSQDL